MKRMKNKILAILMAVILLGTSLGSIILPDQAFSDSERRGLAQFPQLSLKNLGNGSFMSLFEKYTLDQFPLRDSLRGVKAAVALRIFGQEDNNQLYEEDGYLVSMEYPGDKASFERAAQRFTNVYEMYLKDSDTKVYLSVIPDKNYFMAEKSGHLSMDYASLVGGMTESLSYMEYIDIMDSLSIEDYYLTDSHWKQTALPETADVLASAMGQSLSLSYEMVTLEHPFYGVYYGQFALPVEPDILTYLTNPIVEQLVVYDHQNQKEIPVYDMEKAQGKDPYELFLGGPLSLVTLENPNCDNGKELIIFRDSFGSSIAPLLAEAYSKVTLVDIRYMQPAMLGEYMDFENQDVLFLYSTSLLNNSSTLK